MTQQEESQISKSESIVIEEFIKELEDTAKHVEELLNEVRNSKIDAVTIKTELKYVIENVKDLSVIIKDDGHSKSVLTRLALLEQSINEIKEYVLKDTDSGSDLNIRLSLLEQKVDAFSLKKDTTKKKTEDPEGKWKLYVAIATGVFTLIGSIGAALLQYFTE